MPISRLMKKVQGCKKSEEIEKEKRSYTEAYQTDEDCGYGYKVVCCCKKKYRIPIQAYRGENAVYKFMEKMHEEVEYCKGVIKKRFNKPLVMTEDDGFQMGFKQMDTCHMRVRDITGKFRGQLTKSVT